MFSVFANFLMPALPKGVEFIGADEAREVIDAGGFDLLLDVRSPMEWAAGRIPGARLAPVTSIHDHLSEIEKHKDKRTLIYCRTSNRASRAAWLLSELGFTNLKVMQGGVEQWSRSGYPLEN